ncbi:MAG: CPXCG motif-containing cysteine-rich protein [Oceanospirillales bacterium]|uniref:Cysteine-rich CPXCG n=1 Tax=Marinobacterium halophilum TaxID=267374 RepID=A0A2P8EW49_9GAMM|nr:CPXCG motif-containing cysteine-rich protein [Marinobacterium halophilum]MBR9827033.1 CPXCG motif-containing cysteine-rich protein [Oceanospirillales bacterium]PSL13704.1 Cysteine-rich CPXCG [Marinobacterium halophilum]
MNPLEVVELLCPWCSEPISLTVDVTEPEQEYSEDCTVCCSPMTVRVVVGTQGAPEVSVEREGG